MSSKKRVFITGLAGMIGYHAAIRLFNSGWQVTGLDNFNNYYDVSLKRDRAALLQRKQGISVIEHDLRSHNLSSISEINSADVILHLAAYAGVRHSYDHPQFYIDNNISGTQNLISQIEHLDKPVVYASTSCVMHGQKLPWREVDLPSHQNNPYGWSKRVNECQFMHSKLKKTIGLRFFTVYGPFGRPDMALFTFTKNIVNGLPIELYNHGEMYRDFTYVDDITQGVEIILNRIMSVEQSGHEIYNIGFGEKVNLMDFLSEIETNLGRTAEKKLLPPHPADVPATWSDTAKLKKLGYNPTISVRQGVTEFIRWYKSYYKVN